MQSQKLKSIVYGGFKFPNNPSTTGFKCGRSYIQHKYPGLVGAELEDFSVDAISITGEGVFFGDNCYKTFKKLYKVYKKDGVVSFSHPVFTQVDRALMVNLTSRVDAEDNIIHYSFEIIADTTPIIKEKLQPLQVKKPAPTETPKASYKVGDIVHFNGGTHYVSSYSNAKGYHARAGTAKITLGPNCKGNGHAHPWHLIHTDSSSNVYGWVNEGTFT